MGAKVAWALHHRRSTCRPITRLFMEKGWGWLVLWGVTTVVCACGALCRKGSVSSGMDIDIPFNKHHLYFFFVASLLRTTPSRPCVVQLSRGGASHVLVVTSKL